jgi:hypothetical protein
VTQTVITLPGELEICYSNFEKLETSSFCMASK